MHSHWFPQSERIGKGAYAKPAQRSGFAIDFGCTRTRRWFDLILASALVPALAVPQRLLGTRHLVVWRVQNYSPGSQVPPSPSLASTQLAWRVKAVTIELSSPRRHTALGRGRDDVTRPWRTQAKAARAGRLERSVMPHRALPARSLPKLTQRLRPKRPVDTTSRTFLLRRRFLVPHFFPPPTPQQSFLSSPDVGRRWIRACGEIRCYFRARRAAHETNPRARAARLGHVSAECRHRDIQRQGSP